MAAPLLLLVVLTLWAIYGAFRADLAPSQIPLTVRYVSGIVVQWLIVGSTIAGLYDRRNFVSRVLGLSSRVRPWKDLLIGLAILLSGWLAILILRLALKTTPLRMASASSAMKSIVPHTGLELTIWVFVALTAGICEEFIFRGYLQHQMSEWFSSVSAGIVLPSLLFGCLHIYQGIGNAIAIAGLGIVYGIFVACFGNLRGVMIAHAMQDLLAGLVHYLRHS